MWTMSCNKLHVALQVVSHTTAIFGQQRCRRLKIDDSRSVCKYRLVKQSTLVVLWTPDVCRWPCPSCWLSRGTPIKLCLTSYTYTFCEWLQRIPHLRTRERSSQKWYLGSEEVEEADKVHHLGFLRSVYFSTISCTTEQSKAGRSTFFALNTIAV